MHACMHAYMPGTAAGVHTCMRACMHAYIHAWGQLDSSRQMNLAKRVAMASPADLSRPCKRLAPAGGGRPSGHCRRCTKQRGGQRLGQRLGSWLAGRLACCRGPLRLSCVARPSDARHALPPVKRYTQCLHQCMGRSNGEHLAAVLKIVSLPRGWRRVKGKETRQPHNGLTELHKRDRGTPGGSTRRGTSARERGLSSGRAMIRNRVIYLVVSRGRGRHVGQTLEAAATCGKGRGHERTKSGSCRSKF